MTPQQPQAGVVYCCPEQDREPCGRRPEGWCASCPLKAWRDACSQAETARPSKPSAEDVAEAVRLAQAFQNSADWLLKGEHRKPLCGAGDMLSAASLLLRLAGNHSGDVNKMVSAGKGDA